jgi:DNA-binding response OmpR family regulator
MKILIVEDDEVCNNLLKALLEAEGHSVFTTDNGIKGLLALETDAIELVISDAQLPMMNGFTFLSMIKKDLRHKAIPFIMYTACFIDRAHESLAYDLGADKYLRKSGHSKEILQAVETFLTRTNVYKLNNN